MKIQFNASRVFFADSGWYVYMREGDENYQVHHFFGNNIKSYDEGAFTLAGPFRSERLLKNWLVGFLALYGKSRDASVEYIPDDVILTDRNTIYL